MAATTSYDYWWPYPSWGATTTVPASPPTTAVSSMLVPSMITVSATNLLSSASRLVVETSSIASTTSSASIIRITALAPVFAVLAAILGALSAWFFLRWQARRRNNQAHGSSMLHTGPRYAAPPESQNSVPQGSHSSYGGSANLNEASTLLQEDADSEKKGWISRAFSRSSRQSQAVSVVNPVGCQPTTRDLHNVRNPYSVVDNDAPVNESRNDIPQRSGAHLMVNVASPDMFSPSDNVPFETLRHKSIRRAILERLKFGTLRRPSKMKPEDQPDVESGRSPIRRVSSRRGHRRNDSDYNIRDIQGNPSRASSVTQGNIGRTPMMSPPGFRIIEEDTEAVFHPGEHARLMGTDHREGSDLGTPSRENQAWKWTASWSPSPSIRTEDSYTALPVRRAPTKKGGPVSAATSLPRTDEYPSALPEITRAYSSVLPSSPPQLMSPPLHSTLFFSDFGSPLPDFNQPKEPARATVSPPERHGNRLYTKREPEPLPFPCTSSSSPYRGRLKKPRSTSPPLPFPPEAVTLHHPQHAPISPTTPYDEQVYAERLLARQSALDKVGDIVSRGLSQRDIAIVGGKIHTGSFPNVITDRATRMDTRDGVGAIMGDGHGIEQRLGLLRESESAVLEQ